MPAKLTKKPVDPKDAERAEEEDVERDTQADLTELQRSFCQRANREKDRFLQTTDSEYWCCLCFDSREQKEEFLRRLGLIDLGDKYLDGREVAARLGAAVSDSAPRRFLKSKPDRRLDELSRPLKEAQDGEEEIIS